MIHNIITNYTFLNDMYSEVMIPSSIKVFHHSTRKNTQWALDCRIALGQSKYLKSIAMAMLDILRKHNVVQIAAKGVGSIALIGGIAALGENIQCGYIRDKRKEFGFQNLIEGKLDKDKPVFVIDDILSSGKTANSIYDILVDEGYTPTGYLCIYKYKFRKQILKYDVVEVMATLEMKRRK